MRDSGLNPSLPQDPLNLYSSLPTGRLDEEGRTQYELPTVGGEFEVPFDAQAARAAIGTIGRTDPLLLSLIHI